jgi:hypothetical protein
LADRARNSSYTPVKNTTPVTYSTSRYSTPAPLMLRCVQMWWWVVLDTFKRTSIHTHNARMKCWGRMCSWLPFTYVWQCSVFVLVAFLHFICERMFCLFASNSSDITLQLQNFVKQQG